MQELTTTKEILDVLSQGYTVVVHTHNGIIGTISYRDRCIKIHLDRYKYTVDLPSTMEKLYLFVRDKDLEYRWRSDSNKVDVVIPFSLLQEFYNVFRGSKFAIEQVMPCVLRDEYLVFTFDTCVEQYDKLKLDEIFPEQEDGWEK